RPPRCSLFPYTTLFRSRERLFPKGMIEDSLSPRSNTGDGLSLANKIGAQIDPSVDSSVLYFPCSIHTHKNGYKAIWPHIILDRRSEEHTSELQSRENLV